MQRLKQVVRLKMFRRIYVSEKHSMGGSRVSVSKILE